MIEIGKKFRNDFFFFMGNQLMFNCDSLKLYKCLTSALSSILSLLNGKENTSHRFYGFNKFTLSVPICSTHVPLKYQTDLVVANSESRPPEFKSSGSLSILCCSGTCPKLVPPYSWGTLKYISEKSFISLQEEEKSSLLKTQQIWLGGLSSCPIFSDLFFAVDQERPKSNLSYKKQDSDGYKGSGQGQPSYSCASLIQYMCFTEKQQK